MDQLSFEDLSKIRSLGGSGVLNNKDVSELGTAVQRVLDLMIDGEWHSADEIKLAAGTNGRPASEGLRRMRELRRWYKIERRRDGQGRNFDYRLHKTGEAHAS